MISAFMEAVTDLALPCSLTLVVPGVAAALATRANPLAVALSTFGAMTVIGWLRLTGQVPSHLNTWMAVAVGALMLVSFASLSITSTRVGQRATAGAVIGAAAVSIWTPCVGEELGAILNLGPDDPLGVLLPFAAFVAGVSLVSVGAALGRIAFEPSARLSRSVSALGTAVGIVVALLLGSGLYSDVVAQLVIWSL